MMTISGLFFLEKFRNFPANEWPVRPTQEADDSAISCEGGFQSKEMENLSITDAAIDERVAAPPSVNVLTGTILVKFSI